MQTDTEKQSSLAEQREVYEIQLQSSWNKVSLKKTFELNDGRLAQVISPGTWNVESGPDFINAEIRFDDEVLRGDVEIHFCPSDWHRHGHHKDRAYDNVILHVVAQTEHGSKQGPNIPILVLKPRKSKIPLSESDKFRSGQCAACFADLSDKQIGNFLRQAGIERFFEKTTKFMREMIKNGVETSASRSLFEALGYKKNRENFLTLFDRFSLYDKDLREKHLELIIWGESGLLPDPAVHDLPPDMRKFVKELWSDWWRIRVKNNKPIPWIKSGVRPLNSPERRLAALIMIMRQTKLAPIAFLAEKISNSVKPEQFWSLLKENLLVKDPLWSSYSNFFDQRKKPAAVLGEQRALDLSVNVLLPSLRASALISRQDKLANFALEAWLSLPATQENRIVKIAKHKWFAPPSRAKDILKSAATHQGVLRLYRTCCEANNMNCRACALGNIAKET